MRAMFVAALAASAFALPVSAAEPNVEFRVQTAGLDLSNPRDASVLQLRVERMARQACEVRDPLGRAAPKTDWACVKEARADAARRLAAAKPARQVAAGN